MKRETKLPDITSTSVDGTRQVVITGEDENGKKVSETIIMRGIEPVTIKMRFPERANFKPGTTTGEIEILGEE
jgi:hypothetical protein